MDLKSGNLCVRNKWMVPQRPKLVAHAAHFYQLIVEYITGMRDKYHRNPDSASWCFRKCGGTVSSQESFWRDVRQGKDQHNSTAWDAQVFWNFSWQTLIDAWEFMQCAQKTNNRHMYFEFMQIKFSDGCHNVIIKGSCHEFICLVQNDTKMGLQFDMKIMSSYDLNMSLVWFLHDLCMTSICWLG